MTDLGDYLQIDDRTWNVRVLSLSRGFNILYSDKTGRTMSNGARMLLDPLGTFVGHKITVARNGNSAAAIAEFDALFDYLAVPRTDGIHVKCAYGQTAIDYDAYVSGSGDQQVQRIDTRNGVTYWGAVTLNIVPMEAQEVPS